MYCSNTPGDFSRISGGNFWGELQLGHSVSGSAGTSHQLQRFENAIVIRHVTFYLDRDGLNFVIKHQVEGRVYAADLFLRSFVLMIWMLAAGGSCRGVGLCITQRSSLESPRPVAKGRIKLLKIAPTTFAPPPTTTVTIIDSRFMVY